MYGIYITSFIFVISNTNGVANWSVKSLNSTGKRSSNQQTVSQSSSLKVIEAGCFLGLRTLPTLPRVKKLISGRLTRSS